ncbi:MAG: 2-C-methyl-D-erythritol 2,4-cyclodiphosphate synthase [Candidatus Omnitrophica bacterium]|nr:2-C-methyl-D-erythritol 2,4-cyclodiphosphate synthase [Candidatus Omnitrophota bacterium]MCA9416643.1 2-C-methyl-D-erythritol 2,4-cyclodiphosphate synthase [Candidatus Omnitrophota bacterium]MCA9435501.1 2-C-methyl-D-erythritol 2,4-cyclodiphosphate synthase [Candidatus Omnitrophota bacterium]MCB9769956.1 2-C-methyl-D-erythritol 2,4-cyclodiphosphate synthase [Candidatus Omnitrophota bacterium]MCB9784594.1 2-C-methyl-D-erythritol 2,4-cyclodiphosphate synthase [Candidatus Omnitrophota bacterium
MKIPYRVGIGYDTHQLKPGGPLRLGGIDIPAEVELVGHSDADVLVHAIIDAFLGGASLGDIGDHFPPSEEKYRGIDSMELLDETLKRIYAAGFDPINVDATIIAEKPKLGPYKRQIADCLADRMKLPRDCVNIKATTNEKMGFLGREEGIVAHAVALLVRK